MFDSLLKKVLATILLIALIVLGACNIGERYNDSEGASSTQRESYAAYKPRISPLRTGKPLKEWGIDNGETIISHTFSSFSDPIYPPDFPHFDYVNPDAPQGGTLRLAAPGTFDSFHVYSMRGISHQSLAYIYDPLMVRSEDEVDAYYPLIAQKIEYAKDYSYVLFHLNPRAHFQDGSPITAEDVVFSFQTIFAGGVPHLANYFSNVTSAEAVEEYKVRFSLKEPKREMIADLATLSVIPKKFWEGRDFEEPLREAPLGSGSWFVADYQIGSFILFEKLDDYWALNLPVSKGIKNFKYYRIDFYNDQTAMLETFKAGEYDFRVENSAKIWATQYQGPLFESGAIIQAPFQNTAPPRLEAFIFNSNRKLFSDYRIRRAISYALDFPWMNKNLFYNGYKRSRSYFQNTDYEAKELPSDQELAILNPIRALIPPEVFTTAYEPPSGSRRSEVEQALKLFEQAGWSFADGVLRHNESDEPFEFEIIIQGDDERTAILMAENLKKMGIMMNISLVDSSQYIKRLYGKEFDLISISRPSEIYPNTFLRLKWHSDFSDSNWVSDPAFDYLIEGILGNQNNKEALRQWGRALDRVIQWRNDFLFKWYLNHYQIVHVDTFGKPNVWPQYGVADTAWLYWWFDKEKIAGLAQ